MKTRNQNTIRWRAPASASKLIREVAEKINSARTHTHGRVGIDSAVVTTQATRCEKFRGGESREERSLINAGRNTQFVQTNGISLRTIVVVILHSRRK